MIVSDSTTLIILFDLDKLNILSNIFKKVYIPSSVYKEIIFKGEVKLPSFMEVTKVEQSELLDSLNNILDIGESEAIALAKEKNLALIIDEKKGRKIAKNMNIKIIGLLGLLYLNAKKGFMSKEEVVKFLDLALLNNYRISQKLINEMLGTL